MEYEIEFTKIIEVYYTTIVDAENKEEARKIFDENIGLILENEEPEDDYYEEINITAIYLEKEKHIPRSCFYDQSRSRINLKKQHQTS